MPYLARPPMRMAALQGASRGKETPSQNKLVHFAPRVTEEVPRDGPGLGPSPIHAFPSDPRDHQSRTQYTTGDGDLLQGSARLPSNRRQALLVSSVATTL